MMFAPYYLACILLVGFLMTFQDAGGVFWFGVVDLFWTTQGSEG